MSEVHNERAMRVVGRRRIASLPKQKLSAADEPDYRDHVGMAEAVAEVRASQPVVVDCGPDAGWAGEGTEFAAADFVDLSEPDDSEPGRKLSAGDAAMLRRSIEDQPPADLVIFRSLLPGFLPHLRRRILDGELICVMLHVPDGKWAGRAASVLVDVFRQISLDSGRVISATVTQVQPERFRTEASFYPDGVLDRLARSHVLVTVLPKQSGAANFDVMQVLADVELHFSPAYSVDVIEAVIKETHLDFAWDHSVDAHRLRPEHLNYAVRKGNNGGQVASLLWRLMNVPTEEEIETQKTPYSKPAVVEKPKPGRFEVMRPTEPKLSDMYGYGEAKAFGMQLARDLRAYAEGKLSWSEIYKGVVFHGPSGTGKTILARSIAAEAGVAFVPMSYSDLTSTGRGYQSDIINGLIEAHGAADKAAPCILFFDELDSLTARGSSRDYDSFHTAIINTELTLLDGTNRREGVVVIGATNRPDALDPALIRSGRLERLIYVGLPDEDGLLGIFGHHMPGIPVEVYAPIATALAGTASGADVERYAREARRKARDAGRDVSVDDLFAVAMPPDDRMPERRRLIAVHEAGHAVAYMLRGRIPRSVSIVLTGGNAGQVLVEQGWGLQRLPDIEGEVVSLLAGRAAEDVVLGAVSAGAGGEGGDLGVASQLVSKLIGELGLAGKLVVHRPDNTLVEAELQRLYAVAVRLVRERQADVEALAELLLEKRVMSQSALQAFAAERGIRGAR